MSKEKDVKLFGSIAKKSRRGLEKLAEESEAEEMREHRLKRKLKKYYRRYIKKPEAQPVEV
ncbi:hypothetical protein [Candidatus Nanohalobium constans]|uniref:Uncharacterized protein n=1 Tax=Candidatus Nanohalobium constans TaxID=2565781 RepID=A0A5Q0UHK9_9ARCH|nr:hypothetical protein [Candidatus Nanohalobium constans]QGA80379.1 hypothetical protein LC1Nh_0479 [Candidatus Nanohalobium constans]